MSGANAPWVDGELVFAVPAATRAALAAEMARGSPVPACPGLWVDDHDGAAPRRPLAQARHSSRRVRTRGAVVDVAVHDSLLPMVGSADPVQQIGFVLHAGSAAAMLALVARWRRRFGLVHAPHSQAAWTTCQASGLPCPPLRQAARPAYARGATAHAAFGAVLDECLAQITRNASGLVVGDPALRAAHVHQLRVGIRRLRSALRSFRGWVPMPPVALVAGLRTLFSTLGLARDSDVLDSGVVADLRRAGGPAPTGPQPANGPGRAATVAATITAAPTQQTLLAWITWRAWLHALPEGGAAAPTPASAPARRRRAQKRLQRWHARILADVAVFDSLDDEALHALRKRIKRQRYATEFFAPWLRQGQVQRYLRALAAIQDCMGQLNDLLVARARYQALVATDAGAWFALGWLAARIAETRAHARPALQVLRKCKPPGA